MKNIKLILVSVTLCIILMCLGFSFIAGQYVPGNDFAAFYYAASVIHDSSVSVSDIYNLNKMYLLSPDYGIPVKPMPFIYSPVAAYILSPLAFITFNAAKAIWPILSLIIYLICILLVLRYKNIRDNWFWGILLFTLTWPPFWYNQVWLQTNSLVLMFIIVAFITSEKQPLISGAFLALAMSFKLFPIAIALVLGIKNWRITVSCLFVFAGTLLTPGSMEWFGTISNVSSFLTTNLASDPYRWFGPGFVFWIAIIAGITAFSAYKMRHSGYDLLFSMAIPAMILVLPSLNYAHLTLLILCFTGSWTSKPLYIASFLAIILSFPLDLKTPLQLLPTIGIVMIWIAGLLSSYSTSTSTASVKTKRYY